MAKEGEPNWEIGIDTIQRVAVRQIKPHPLNPRGSGKREAIDDLIEDIREVNIKEPIVLIRRKGSSGNYVLSGHRRLYAAIKAGLETVPVRCDPRILDPADEIEELLAYNGHREDMPLVDLAKAYKKLMELRKWTSAELCARKKITPLRLGYIMKLLEYQPEVQQMVNSGSLSPTAAYWVSRNATTASEEVRIAKLNVNGDPKYSTSALEKRAKGKESEKGGKPIHPGKGGSGKPPQQSKRTDRRFWIESLRSSVIVQSNDRTLTDEQLAQALMEACGKLSVNLK